MYKSLLPLAFSAALLAGSALAKPQDAAPPPPPSQDDQAMPQAHSDQRPAPDPDRMMHMLTNQLKLSNDQVNQIRPIVNDQMSQMMAIRNDTTLAPRDRMAKMMSLHDETGNKIKAFLTPDQKTQFDSLQQRQMQRMRDRHGAGPGAGAGAGAPPPPPPDGSNQ